MQPSATCKRIEAVRFVDVAAENLSDDVLEKLSESFRSTQRAVSWFTERLKLASSASREGISLVFELIGMWGSGKTALIKLLSKIAEEAGFASFKIRAEDLISGDRKNREVDHTEFALRILRLVEGSGGRSAIVFIDEIEGLIGAEMERRIGIVAAFTQFLRFLRSRDVVSDPYPQLHGRVHVVLVLTPSAHHQIVRALEHQGYAGWLVRREDVFLLLPVSKTEVKRALNEIFRAMAGVELEDVIEDLAALNILYVVSRGSPGTLVKLAQSIIMKAAKDCGGGLCVCRLSLRELLDVLRNTPIESLSDIGAEVVYALNRELVEDILRRSPSDENLPRLLALGVVGEDPELRALLEHAGIEVAEVDLYSGSPESMVSAMLDVLRGSGLDIGRDELELALRNLFVYTPSGEIILALPADSDSLSAVLSMHVPVVLGGDVRSRIAAALNGLRGVKRVGKAMAISYLSVRSIAPSASINVIPFITSAVVSRILIDRIQRIQREDLAKFIDLVKRGFSKFLLNLELHGGKKLFEIRSDAVGYVDGALEVPIKIVYSFSSDVLMTVAESCTETEICLLLMPASATVNEDSLPWYVKAVKLSYLDQLSLAVAAAVDDLGERYIDDASFKLYVRELETRLNIVHKIVEWLAEAERRGVLVTVKPLTLYRPVMELLSSAADRERFFSWYRLLLEVALQSVDESVVREVYKAFRVRPIAFRNRWCDLPLPSHMHIDIEPDNPRLLSEEAIASAVQKNLGDVLSLAERVMMAVRDGSKFLLVEHPVESRIRSIVQSVGEMNLDDLRKRFVISNDRDSVDLFDNLLDTAARRGLIAVEGGKVVLLSREVLLRELESVRRELNRIASAYRRILTENGVSSAVAHVLMVKAKGWKIIFADHVLEYAEDKLRKAEISGRTSLLGLKELVEFVSGLFDRFIIPSIVDVLNVLRKSDEMCRKAEEKALDLVREINRVSEAVLGLKVLEGVEGRVVSYLIRPLCSIKEDIRKTISSTTIDDLLKALASFDSRTVRDEYRRVFWFNEREACTSRYHFNYVLLSLETRVQDLERIFNEFEKRIQSITAELDEMKKTLENVDRYVVEEALRRLGIEADKLSTLLKDFASKGRVDEVLNELAKVFRDIRRVIQEVLAETMNRRELLKKAEEVCARISSLEEDLELGKTYSARLEQIVKAIRGLCESIKERKLDNVYVLKSLIELGSEADKEMSSVLGVLTRELEGKVLRLRTAVNIIVSLCSAKPELCSLELLEVAEQGREVSQQVEEIVRCGELRKLVEALREVSTSVEVVEERLRKHIGDVEYKVVLAALRGASLSELINIVGDESVAVNAVLKLVKLGVIDAILRASVHEKQLHMKGN